MNNISLHVKGLGKIEEATIELAPLTLFVGDNNSGKSYLMTVLYGLLDFETLFRFSLNGFGQYKKNKAVKACLELIELIYRSSDKDNYKLTEQDHKNFNDAFNVWLKHNKDQFVKSIFNYGFELGEISINIPYEPLGNITTMSSSHSFRTRNDVSKENEKVFSFNLNETPNVFGQIGFGMEKESDSEDILVKLLVLFVCSYLNTKFLSKEVLFFPTSRTGFMLGYKSMISKSIDSTFSRLSIFEEDNENTNLTLSKPSVDFLQRINGLSLANKEKLVQKKEFINNILDGLLKGIDGNLEIIEQSSEVFFAPNGTNIRLPLYVTSGVVTELAPLILFLLNYRCSRVMMEEPEMGLHPKLQKEIARVLVRFSNNGIPVIATTHSDTIIQHINNMIKLSNIKRNKTLLKDSGYESDDVLSCDKVRVYQFDTDNKLHKTTVTNLKCSESGFETPTFYNILLEMYEESKNFEDKIK